MTGYSSICIHNDFTSGKSSVGNRSSYNKAPCRIDQISGLIIDKIRWYYCLDNLPDNVGIYFFVVYAIIMLCTDDNAVYSLGDSTLVFYGYLGFSIRAEIGQNVVLSYLCQAAAKLVGQGYRKGISSGVSLQAKPHHQTLVAGPNEVEIFLRN